jgi:protein TonB
VRLAREPFPTEEEVPMPQRLFQDLVSSASVRRGRRGRALPFSLAFHAAAVSAVIVLPQLVTELPPVAAAPPTPIPVWTPVRVDVAPAPPRPPVAAQGQPRTTAATPSTPATSSGPAVPSDVSQLGQGEILDDSPAPCFVNCSGDGTGSGDGGAILPTGAGYGDGDGTPPPIRRAGRDVTPPARLAGNPPVYPELARRARVQGEVVVECTIDPSGRVVDASVTRSNPVFDAAALDAVRSWRYRPTLVDGVPVPVLMTVTVRFHLR